MRNLSRKAAVFTPQTGIPAGTRETVMVSAGDGSVRSEQKFSFTTAGYSTLRLQELRGTNPDGSHYADPVQWVSYFEGGSAVHYIARGSYGYPQPLGCVELPYSPPRRRTPTCRTARWSR